MLIGLDDEVNCSSEPIDWLNVGFTLEEDILGAEAPVQTPNDIFQLFWYLNVYPFEG